MSMIFSTLAPDSMRAAFAGLAARDGRSRAAALYLAPEGGIGFA
jgi:hypothetical protein